jgi:GABA(A) receptor-associated protein
MEFSKSLESIPLVKRIEQTSLAKSKYYPRLPLIIDRYKEQDPPISQHKYLIGPDIQFSELMVLLRKRIQLKSYQALFLFNKNNMVSMNDTIGNYYHQYGDKDGFLYIIYSTENTFG